MVVISYSLSLSQATFILRVIVQVLSYGGVALLGFIILGNAPRIATVETHDVLNRVVGQASAVSTSLKWIGARVTGKRKDPLPSFGLIIALSIFLVYTIFVSLSDVGLIGFYQCDVPAPSFLDFPASVKTDALAAQTVQNNLLNNTDFSKVRGFRCDSAETVSFGENVTMSQCTSWHNFTYSDPEAFRGLNTTDSDVLMPKGLRQYDYKNSAEFYMNMFIRHAEGERVEKPVLADGIAIDPHATGVKAIFGVPNLSQNQTVYIPKTMALEADVGCMRLGVSSQKLIGSIGGNTTHFFSTKGPWRQYVGPDYLSSVLSKTVDLTREAYLPFFDPSKINDDGEYILSESFGSLNGPAFTNYDRVDNFFAPVKNDSVNIEVTNALLGNCTQELFEQLGLPSNKTSSGMKQSPKACGFLGIGGTAIANTTGSVYQVVSRMVCATATKVNMVSATIETDTQGNVKIQSTRLPSNLHTVFANYWDVNEYVDNPIFGNATVYGDWDPIMRFTLSDNATGPLEHPIYQQYDILSSDLFAHGAASVGPVFTTLGNRMLSVDDLNDGGLGMLNSNYYQGNFSAARVTKWAGEVGASYIRGSVGYNGWTSRNNPALTVASTGGRQATCYNLKYGIAFLPLFISALVVGVWSLIIIVTSSLSAIRHSKDLYGGVTPYTGAVAPSIPPHALLVWENQVQPHLEVVYDGKLVEGSKPEPLVDFLRKPKW